MDLISVHVRPRPRRFDVAPQLVHVGLVEKGPLSVANHAFDTFNFSLILEGEGFYDLKGVRHEVKAPMTILQWPGEPMHYGPNQFWRELYLVYPPEAQSNFEKMGLYRSGEWSFPLRVNRSFEDSLLKFRKGLAEDIPADQLDLMALELLVMARGGAGGSFSTSQHPAILKALSWMRDHLDENFDLALFCRENHVSPSNFRRLWALSQERPPYGTFIKLKLERAAKELTETPLRISEVARALGFDDPLHFSRRFRQHFGMSPREYRTRYQPDHLLGPSQKP